MKKRFCALLLGMVLCLQMSITTVAAGAVSSATGQVGGNSITVSIRELKPGYYLGAVWDGDELLTLFDATVGKDGILNATVEIGKTLVTNDSLIVGISGANTNSTNVTYPVTLRSSGGSFSGGGGGGSFSSGKYAISVPGQIVGGSVKISPTSARKGGTVTITAMPDEGYKLDKLTATDAKGNAIQVSNQADGRYNFTMADSKVNINVTFAIIPQTTFIDVAPDAYYAEAVAWAVAEGITSGTSATTFSPNSSCTRAQMVTFLWRSAGSPAPQGDTNPFVDVQPETYYYNAVIWAVEQRITSGTSTTTFSPDASVTRGQTVTFLYRAAGSPTVTGGNAFTDVDGGLYYSEAVQWAVNKSITSGTSTTTFSPNADCTRAQIVTFLYRGRA